MPYTDTQPPLPWSGSNPTSRHCSQQAAVSASETRVWKTERYRQYLQGIGRATDRRAAEDLGWEIGTICSIRNGLVEKGMVEVAGTIMGAKSKRVTLWRIVRVTREMCEEEAE